MHIGGETKEQRNRNFRTFNESLIITLEDDIQHILDENLFKIQDVIQNEIKKRFNLIGINKINHKNIE